jgi:surface protein
MSGMFAFSSWGPTTNNGGIQSLYLGENFNTSKVKDMSGMFRGCDRLRYLPLNGFDTSSVTNMKDMFAGLKSMTSIDLASFDTSSVTNMSGMFKYDINLRYISVYDNFVTTAVSESQDMFGYMGVGVLNGGRGTVYSNSNPTDKTYAHYDEGPSNPGYFRMPK